MISSRAHASAAAVALVLGGGVVPVTAQTVVPVREEPRHRLVHETPDLRVLDVLIQPGDTTLFHRHDAPIAYVQIDASVVNQQRLGGSWGDVRPPVTAPRGAPGRVTWNESYGESPVVHRVTALGPGQFRLIGVINRGGGDSGRSGPMGAFPEPDRTSRFFSQAGRELQAGDSLAWGAGPRPVVVVLAAGAEGGLMVVAQDDAGSTTSLRSAGDFTILAPDRDYTIVNAHEGATPIAFVEVR